MAPPPVSLALSRQVVRPGQPMVVHGTLRDIALARAPTTAAVTLRAGLRANGQSIAQPLRLWPAANAGEMEGRVRAPRAAGMYIIDVASPGASASMPLVVSTDARAASPDAFSLGDWIAARGGRSFAASRPGDLASALEQDIRAPSVMEHWHPMRSAWWMLPFALALAGEWWVRRRRGLR
jgi:hypothetical protein